MRRGLFLGGGCCSCLMPFYLAVSTLFQLLDCGGKSSLPDKELWDLQKKCIITCILHTYINKRGHSEKKDNQNNLNTWAKYMEMINSLWCYYNITLHTYPKYPYHFYIWITNIPLFDFLTVNFRIFSVAQFGNLYKQKSLQS